MLICGQIEGVKYRNEENGYTVVIVESNGEYITCVGKFPAVVEGQRVEIDGTLKVDRKYGEQIAVNSVNVLPPNSIDGIFRYLSSGLIKGIGPIMAEKIVNQFGESTLEVIEYNPSKLAEIKGISPEKALKIAEAYNDLKDMQGTIMFLQNYNISTTMGIKIYKTYLSKTQEILKNNPYKLVEDVDGIGFLTADKIAQKLGIPADSVFRFRAGILYALQEHSEKNGNTCITKEQLIELTCKLLQVGLDENMVKIDDILHQLKIECVIREFVQDDLPCVMRSQYYYMEQSSAQKLLRLKYNFSDVNLDLSAEIEEYERVNQIKLHPNQANAVKTAVNSGVCVITGGPGTGKTTIVKCVLSCLKQQNKKCLLLAPTGRAAKRLNESTGENASTIHRALELDFKSGNGGNYARNENNPLPQDVIIVDEFSMVDTQLLYALLKAIKQTAQLIVVGDKDQLPSVGAGNVLADILNSGVVSVVELTEIYRQDSKSYIITNAHLINHQKMPILDNSSNDFFFENKSNLDEMLHTCVSLVTVRLPHYLKVNANKIQVLAPMKAGLCGVDNLNKELQKVINPSKPYTSEIQTETTIYRTGDKVMQTVNNYDQTWEKMSAEGVLEYGQGVFNGDCGTIEAISNKTGEVTVHFEDGRRAVYLRENISELMLSYAITIHKSQGSEFDVVVIPVVAGSTAMLTKNLLYTAVTRAKKMVVLVGTKQNIFRMVSNNYTIKRFSMLKNFLLEEEKKINELFCE